MVLDIFILVSTVAVFIFGFVKGAIGQLSMIAGFIAGIVASRLFGESLARFFTGTDSPGMLETAAVYAIVFILAYLLAWVIVRVFRKTVHAASLGFVDRLAGAVIKTFVWLMIVSLAMNLYLIVKGNEHEIEAPGKPWRAMIVRLAPATLGFLKNELSHEG